MLLVNPTEKRGLDFFQRLKQVGKYVPFRSHFEPLYRPALLALKKRVASKNFLKSGTYVLEQADRALSDIGVPFWLEFGTLLGAVRNDALITHDSDVDVGVLLRDRSPAIQESMKAVGFKLEHTYQSASGLVEETYVLRNVGLDIFYFKQEEDVLSTGIFPVGKDEQRYVLEVKTTYSGFEKRACLGSSYLVPKDIPQRLRDTYGEKYLIPDPNFYTPTMALNSKILDEEVTVIDY